LLFEVETVGRLAGQQQADALAGFPLDAGLGLGGEVEAAQGKILGVKGKDGPQPGGFGVHGQPQAVVGLEEFHEAQAEFLDRQLKPVAFPLAKPGTLGQGPGHARRRTGKSAVRRDFHRDAQKVDHSISQTRFRRRIASCVPHIWAIFQTLAIR